MSFGKVKSFDNSISFIIHYDYTYCGIILSSSSPFEGNLQDFHDDFIENFSRHLILEISRYRNSNLIHNLLKLIS